MEEDIQSVIDRMYEGIYDRADQWKLVREIDQIKERLKARDIEIHQLKFRLNHIRDNTECIGLNLCHVDGNCIHCLASIHKGYTFNADT